MQNIGLSVKICIYLFDIYIIYFRLPCYSIMLTIHHILRQFFRSFNETHFIYWRVKKISFLFFWLIKNSKSVQQNIQIRKYNKEKQNHAHAAWNSLLLLVSIFFLVNLCTTHVLLMQQLVAPFDLNFLTQQFKVFHIKTFDV